MKRRGFTMMEILVVLAIIGILAGLTVRVSSLVYDKVARAKEAKRIELLRMCLEEYYKIYGEYPSSTNMQFESYESEDGEYPPEWNQILAAIRRDDPDYGITKRPGLIFYLMANPRIGFHDPESSAWREYFDKVGYWSDAVAYTNLDSEEWNFDFGEFSFTNIRFTIFDSWHNQYRYTSSPPRYQSYRLWSMGPDGVSGTADDIGREGWLE
ncbi:MAG: prepilin-type N-terminal cleavage/methylation domain-containing protein [Lentisphaerae bacterium]|nr:prepilin-type N-terminal cleavage/methylation domain-containing protein [Lentisphaerota bacterium]